MNNSFALFIDKKEKFNSIIEGTIDKFGGNIKKVTKKNYILTQNDDSFIIDITPQIIKCFIFSEKSDKITKEITEFYKRYDKDGCVSVYKY